MWSVLVAVVACAVGFYMYILVYDYKKNVGKHNIWEHNYLLPSSQNGQGLEKSGHCTDTHVTNECRLQCSKNNNRSSNNDSNQFIIKLSSPLKAKAGGTFKGNFETSLTFVTGLVWIYFPWVTLSTFDFIRRWNV